MLKKINISIKKKKNALKNIQDNELTSYRVQDKESRFLVLDNEDYIENINYQLGGSSFEEFDYDPSKVFSERVTLWIQKRTRNNILCKTWQKFIEPSHVTPGKMYGLVKTHKVNNPVRVITSGCGTAVKNLSVFVEKCLYPEVLEIQSRIQDTFEMLHFIDYLNKSNILTEDCISVSFDVANTFSSIDNQSGIQTVKNALKARQE